MQSVCEMPGDFQARCKCSALLQRCALASRGGMGAGAVNCWFWSWTWCWPLLLQDSHLYNQKSNSSYSPQGCCETHPGRWQMNSGGSRSGLKTIPSCPFPSHGCPQRIQGQQRKLSSFHERSKVSNLLAPWKAVGSYFKPQYSRRHRGLPVSFSGN